jgi:hypothetical protein
VTLGAEPLSAGRREPGAEPPSRIDAPNQIVSGMSAHVCFRLKGEVN